MALIVCKGCGKKVSDTVETCIHCGAPLRETDLEKVSAACEAKEQEPTERKIDEPPFSNYASYDSAQRINLEKEFLSQDPWARKYRLRCADTRKFRSWFVNMLFVFASYLVAYRFLYQRVFERSFYREDAMQLSIMLIVFLLAVSLVGILVTWIVGIAQNRSVKKYIYMKKYQRWLNDAHRVRYVPQFFGKRERELFEQIDLDKISF